MSDRFLKQQPTLHRKHQNERGAQLVYNLHRKAVFSTSTQPTVVEVRRISPAPPNPKNHRDVQLEKLCQRQLLHLLPDFEAPFRRPREVEVEPRRWNEVHTGVLDLPEARRRTDKI